MRKHDSRRGARRRIAAVVVAAALIPVSFATASVEDDVRAAVIEGFERSNKDRKDFDQASKDGVVAFWSSGGLMQHIGAGGNLSEYEFSNIRPKHIEVVVLDGGNSAIAMYYAEGSFQRKGAAPVSNYLTRVMQVWVNEGGTWKTRAAHWSQVIGGTGTNQTAPVD